MADDYPVVIFAHFDTTPFKDPEAYFYKYNSVVNILNPKTTNTTLTVQKSYINASCKLVFSSNGIDGVGVQDNTFNIDANKFTDSKIHFVIRVKTENDTPIKNIPLLSLSALNLSLVDSSGTPVSGVTFYSNFGDLSSAQLGGFFKGYLISQLPAIDVHLSSTVSVSGITLSGSSNVFSIYPKQGIYDIRKINEDNNQEAQFNSLTFQQILQDNPGFFKSFLGQIVGNNNSDPNTLGILTYEKIANFVMNNADIVYSNLSQFTSMLQFINSTYENYNVEFPASLQRLIDIFSIPLSNQIGARNKYALNFDDKGFTGSYLYGINKGAEIDFSSGILYRSTNPDVFKFIIAHEKFSNTYKLVSPLVPDATNITYLNPSVLSYALSTYDVSWGWGLVLPPDVPNTEIPNYYNFYEYKDATENSLLQKFIDFDNPKNTYLLNCSSFNQYAGRDGIVDNILIHHLYSNVGIIST